MSVKLNRDLPYGTVMGLPGVHYEQNGILFNFAGDEVGDGEVERINDEPTPPSPRDDTPIFPAEVAKEDENVVSANAKKTQDTFEQMPLKELKALVIAGGGSWTTKEDAIRFLRGE